MAGLAATDADVAAPAGRTRGRLVLRHRLPVRLWHWLNVVCVFTLLGSGLTIFNAHPRLYWGSYGANYDPAWLEIGSDRQGTSGYLRLGELEVPTTGVLGTFERKGRTVTRAFPDWLTIPAGYSLADGRRYHFLAAWVFAPALILYLLWSLIGRHARALIPTREQLRPAAIWHDIRNHLRLRFPHGEAALSYNFLQRVSYAGVVFVLLPGMVLTGLTMSPDLNAAWPVLLDLFGGRQSARSLHFIFAMLLALFILVHLLMVVLAGPIREIRSMLDRRMRIEGDRP